MGTLPLDGVRIIDLTQVWAGTFATCLLSDMGAEIIKVEARNRPDVMRGPVTITQEEAAARSYRYISSSPSEKPYNRSTFFHGVNRNKRGITINLMVPKGVAIFKELVKLGDIVAENFTYRVMNNFGLGYAKLKEVNPAIIMISMPAYGTIGPYRDYRGVGGTMEPMSGISSLMGYSGGSPANHGMMYPDPVAGLMGASAMLIALHHLRKTGVGQFIDLSQQEASVSLLGEVLMDYSMNRRLRERQGNRHQFMVPHRNYRCRGEDEWIAIAVSSESEWQQLIKVMGEPAWSRDGKFVTRIARLKNQDELDKYIEEWTLRHGKYELMHQLQQVRVPAGAVLPPAEIANDPHLHHRGYFEELDYGEAGKYKTPGLVWKMSATPGKIWRTAPDLGQDSEFVLTDLLGMSRQEYEHLVETQVTGEDPVDT